MSNFTSTPPSVDAAGSALDPTQVAKIFAFSILCVVSLIGNILIIYVIRKDNRLRSTTDILVANMAVSDLVVPLLSLPRQIVNSFYGHNIWLVEGALGLALCRLSYFFQDVSMTVSSYSAVAIATGRFVAVRYPLKAAFMNPKLKFVIAGIWVCSVALMCPYLYMFKLVKAGNSTYCVWVPELEYLWSLVIICNNIPFVITLCLYIAIGRHIIRQVHPGNTSAEAQELRSQRNRRVAMLSAAIVAVYFLCWAPAIAYIMLTVMFKAIPFSQQFNFAAQFIAEASCAMNFFVYLVFNRVYLENFKAIFNDMFYCR